MVKLFEPYTIKNMTLKNRIVMSPMCMYSSFNKDGKVQDFHLVHYPTRAIGQVGLIIVEATAVSPEGRISMTDLGLWDDEHVEGMKKLTSLVKEHGAKIGIQLGHAGRKADVEGDIVAPSPLPFSNRYKEPKELTIEGIKKVVDDFQKAALRAKQAGFDCIEVHGAHGYLINQFLSPLTNKREDEYGGSLENRYRILKEIIIKVREVWDGPLFVRISASDYHEDGMKPEDYLPIVRWMKEDGVDLVDVSSGAVVPKVPINVFPGYQVPFAELIRKETGMPVGTVGLINIPDLAEEILQNGRADLVFLGRELLRNPYWPYQAAKALGYPLEAPEQYRRGWI